MAAEADDGGTSSGDVGNSGLSSTRAGVSTKLGEMLVASIHDAADTSLASDRTWMRAA